MSDTISRRIKQLENQNQKFKKLLETTLQITSEETSKCLQLRNESVYLKKTVAELENQKKQLEEELKLYNQNTESSNIGKTQKGNLNIQNELNAAMKDIQRGSSEIQHLKINDEYLNQIIGRLEEEKNQLLQEILLVKKADEENNLLAQENLKLRQELAQLEQEVAGKPATSAFSGQDLINKLASIENLKEQLQGQLQTSSNLFADPINLPTEHTVLELKLSGLEKQKQRLLTQLRANLLKSADEISKLHSDTSDGQLRKLLNELDIHKTVLMINMTNIKETFSSEINKGKEIREETRGVVPNNNCVVEFCNLSYPICERSRKQENEDRSDEFKEEIKNELLSSFHQKIEEGQLELNSKLNQEKLASGMTSQSSEVIQTVTDMKEADKTSDYSLDNISDDDIFLFEQDGHDLPPVSEEDEVQNSNSLEQERLKDEVSRLEDERFHLLQQLQGVQTSETSATTKKITSEEFTGTAIRDDDFSDNLHRLPLDDATNQMYANEEQMLEQRIRELEEDNQRIRKDLTNLIDDARREREEVEILQKGEQLIKEKMMLGFSGGSKD